MSPRSNRKPAIGQRSTLIKHVTPMSYKLGPTIWSRDTGQRTAWIDELSIDHNMMSYIKKVQGKPRLHVSSTYYLRDSIVVVAAVVRTRPRAIPLAMITTNKSIHGFSFRPGSDPVLQMSELSSCEVRRLNQFETTDIIRIRLAVLHARLSRE